MPRNNSYVDRPIKHSLDSWKLKAFNVAKYFGISPNDIFEKWSLLELNDAEEYYEIMIDLEAEESKKYGKK